jgi:hypothetical protein
LPQPPQPAPSAADPAPDLQTPDLQKPDLQKEVLEEKRFVTGRISETTRYLGFGLLATFYAIISSADAFPRQVEHGWPLALKIMALCGILAIFLDYLQYSFGRIAVQKALDRKDKPFLYNRKWLSYRGRQACFWSKQAMALAGWAIFILVIASNL